MLQYQNHELVCVISLCSEQLEFTIADLQILDDTGQNFSFSLDIVHNERSGRISQISHHNEIKLEEGFTRIKNITNAIYNIYNSKKEKKEDISKDKQLRIITKYFNNCLNEISATNKIPMAKWYFVFVVEDEWTENSKGEEHIDIVSTLLKPLLQRLIAPHEKDTITASLVTRLEALILQYQFRSPIVEYMLAEDKTSLNFIHSENRCIMYELRFDGKSTDLHTIYFQLKEDYNLRLFNEKYYIPKVEYVKSSQNMNDTDLKDFLEQLIIKQHLKAEHLLNTILPQPTKHNRSTVSDRIMYSVLNNVLRYLEKGKDFRFVIDFEFDDYPLKQGYISSSQMDILTSSDFFFNVMDEISSILSSQLKQLAACIDAENTKVPYFRKSIIIRQLRKDLQPNELYITRIAFLLLRNLIRKQRNSTIDALDWYFLDENIRVYEAISLGVVKSTKRKAMIQNIGMRPVVVEETGNLNLVGQPCFYPAGRNKRENFLSPKTIVYIDIPLYMSNVVFETADNKQQWTNNLVDMAIRDTDLSSFESFVESKSRSSANTVLQSNGTLQKLLNELCCNPYVVNKPLKMASLELWLKEYLKGVFEYVNLHLKNQDIQLQHTAYVLSLEKLVMQALQMKSRNDVFEFIKQHGIINLRGNPRKLIVVDRGEKAAWHMLEKSDQQGQFYYVHSHLNDNYIYLKLHQVVDVSDSNLITEDSPAIFIRDKLIPIRNVYEQTCENLWNHIQSLDDEEKDEFIHSTGATSINYISGYKVFQETFVCFLKEELLCGQDCSDRYEVTHNFNIASSQSVTSSLRQLIQTAITPAIESIVHHIISCLMNTEIFGFYEVAQLLVTGNCLCIKRYNEGYNYLVTREISKILKELIRVKTYKSRFKLSVETCKENQPKSRIFSHTYKRKPFCYNIFAKGELRVVSSTTYFISDLFYRFKEYFEMETLCKYDKSYSLMLRGHESPDRRIKINIIGDLVQRHTIDLVLFKFTEPCNPQDYQDAEKFLEIDPLPNHLMQPKGKPTNFIVIEVQNLFYRSCIKISCETYYRTSALKEDVKSLLLAERMTLKYF